MNSVQSTGHTGSMSKKDSQIEELVASSPGQRNWRGIFIALLVIAAVLGLIVFSIFLLSPEDEGLRVKGRRMTLSDINGNGLKWRPFNGTWINGNELVYRDPTGGLSILHTENLTVRILMTNSTFRQLNAEKFIVSPDLNFVILLSDFEKNRARYTVYEVKTRNSFPLSPRDDVRDVPKLQYVVWAPNTTKSSSTTTSNNSNKNGNPSQAIAFVYENDLYYKPKVQNDLVCRITMTGKKGIIYNGIPDWFYSNIPELKSETIAFSSDGSYLSFLTFNDEGVSQYNYTYLRDNQKYPEIKSIRYPKAETKNPNVTVNVVDLSILKFIKQVQLQVPMVGNDSYVGNMIWLSATDISITYMNREQTKALTVICRAPAFQCREAHTETIIENGWVLPADKPIFSKTESYFKQTNHTEEPHEHTQDLKDHEFKSAGFMLKRLPVRDGEHGYYRHVVFISTTDMRTIPLTMGTFEVTEILGWDEKNEIIYFMATLPSKPGQRHLHKINLKLNVTENPNRIYVTPSQPICMTCENLNFNLTEIKMADVHINGRFDGVMSALVDSPLTTADPYDFYDPIDIISLFPEKEKIPSIANNCLYNKIYFSKDYSYYAQECLGPESPSIYLVETASNMKIAVLHNGDVLRERLAMLATPQIRTFDVEIIHGFHAQVRLLLPPGMKEEEDIAFPLILHIDSSPGSQLVSEKFQVDYNWYICSQKIMIVAQIDARGSGFQGELLRSQIKGHLGTVEIEDQLGVLKYLRDNLKFVDPARICAYGWGYGGYAAGMVLAEDSQRILECTVAINPIVSFGYHNSFFTERHLPLANEYLQALQRSDLSMRAGNIDSRNFLLMHGTADEQIHQQHSLLLAKALIDQGVGFRHQVYTDEGHNLKGTLHHLYKTIEWFLDESFGPLESNDWEPTGFFAFKQ